MRLLTGEEMGFVSGAGEQCSSGGGEASGNNIGGITDSGNIGQDMVNIYEGLVDAMSHIIERVANAL